MDKLTEEQIFTIQLRWACGQSVKATAAELGHSLSTVSKYYGIAKATWNSYDPKVYLDPSEQACSPHRFSNRREVRERVKGRIDNNIDMATGKCVIGCCDGEEPPDNLNSKSSILTTTRSDER